MCDDLEAAGPGSTANADSRCDPGADSTAFSDCGANRSAAGDGSDR